MTEADTAPRVQASVFAKLLTIMLTMAASLLLLVCAFFWFIVNPNINASIQALFEAHAASIAQRSPDRVAAKEVADRLNIYMRYDGPTDSWASADFIPSAERLRSEPHPAAWSDSVRLHRYYIVPAPDGGTYVFAWTLGARMHAVHIALLGLLLFIMVAVIFTAHAVLKRLLRPLRSLGEGVARLGAGELDVVIEQRTRDEFGVLTDAFNQMARRVRDMVWARDQLLLDVSHELRSPLTRMKVALELLPDGEKKSGMAADVAEMEAMIGELLELERLRDGKRMAIRRRDLAQVLREEVQRFASRPPGVQLTAPEFLPADVDEDKIRTVLRNLLENAVKYSLPDSRPIEIEARETAEGLKVQVVDDGPGIPSADVPSLFEPFFRVDRSRSKKTGGYGLGLSICKRVMEAHGGTITVANNAMRGATFTLTFPELMRNSARLELSPAEILVR